MSRLLRTGNNQVTQSYAVHCNLVASKSAWAKGIDIVKFKSMCDDITAHTDGKVIKVIDYMTGTNGKADKEGMGYGNYVMLLHKNNVVTLYAHLATVSVKMGETVAKGRVIGKMGNTGGSYGAHLHFEVRKYASVPSGNLHDVSKYTWLDPTPYIDADLPNQVVVSPAAVPTPAATEDYSKNSTPERFIVKLDGVQKNTYTNYKYAIKYADTIKGVVIDKTTGKQIYPTVSPASVPTPAAVKQKNTFTLTKDCYTFWAVSQKVGCTAADIQKLNPTLNPNNLHVGQVINIP